MKEKEQRNKTLTLMRRQEKKKIREQKIFRKICILSKINLRLFYPQNNDGHYKNKTMRKNYIYGEILLKLNIINIKMSNEVE